MGVKLFIDHIFRYSNRENYLRNPEKFNESWPFGLFPTFCQKKVPSNGLAHAYFPSLP